MKTSALPPRAQVERQEPGARAARRRARTRGCASSGWTVTASIAKNAERDPGERRREAVHVVEQVERVRHPDEPEDRERPRDDVRVDQLHVRAGREHDHRGGDLQRELQLRRERTHVVDEPGDEQQRDRRRRCRRSARVAGIAPAATAAQIPTVSRRRSRRRRRAASGRRASARLDGTATSRRCSPVARSSLIASAEAGRAAIAARVLTSREGKASLLGLCVPACVPTLVAADDGLRRPRSLPRAVLEPLPPRLPGEVQGLAARRPLVAAQPADPARRLPARLRRHLPEPADPALRALPARRARVLDLLRDLDAVGGALARRRGRPGQEGALPAAARRVLDGRDAGGHVRGDGGDPDRPLADLRPRRAVDGVARDPARARCSRPRSRGSRSSSPA